MYLLGQNDSWKKEFVERACPRRAVPRFSAGDLRPYAAAHRLFTLAPLYVYAGVSYSLPDHFEAEAGKRDRLLIDCTRLIFDGLGGWGSILEAWPEDSWADFCRYLYTSVFVAADKQQVWMVRQHLLVLTGTDRAIVSPGEDFVPVVVFLPDGNLRRLNVASGCPARFYWGPPQEALIKAGEKILRCRGRLDGA